MKEFNLEEAKAGKPVVTSEGFPARIVCFNRYNERYEYLILALVLKENFEFCQSYTLEGKGLNNDFLLMKTEKVTLWANVYNVSGMYHIGQILLYSSKEEALENVVSTKDYTYIDTVEIKVEV